MNSKLSRREMMRGSAAAIAAMSAQAALPAWMPRLAFTPVQQGVRGDVLISIFLRGGADMLNMIVPYGEDAYYQYRPKLAIPRPDANADAKVIDLDGFFGLHPALAALLPIFRGGEMVAVQAVGSSDKTRSHFEAMDLMERGIAGNYSLTSGWIGRHLSTLNTGNTSPIRAVGWGTGVQQALRGTVTPVAVKSIVDFHLRGDERIAAPMLDSLNRLYSLENDSLGDSAKATNGAISILAKVDYKRYLPQNGADYPRTNFGLALRQTAAIIRADAGLEAACIDFDGWDTHVNQGGATGQQAALMTSLSQGLAAFHTDMGDAMQHVSVVVMSEFGRRIAENGGGGTDHGHGGGMLLMSGHLSAEPVFAKWPGLAPEALDRGEDLSNTTDYRDVLAELLSKRLNNSALSDIFPNFATTPLGLFKS